MAKYFEKYIGKNDLTVIDSLERRPTFKSNGGLYKCGGFDSSFIALTAHLLGMDIVVLEIITGSNNQPSLPQAGIPCTVLVPY